MANTAEQTYGTYIMCLYTGGNYDGEATYYHYIELARRSSSVCDLANKIEDEWTDQLDQMDLGNIEHDIFRAGLASVDWKDVAESVWMDVELND